MNPWHDRFIHMRLDAADTGAPDKLITRAHRTRHPWSHICIIALLRERQYSDYLLFLSGHIYKVFAARNGCASVLKIQGWICELVTWYGSFYKAHS